MKGHASLPSSGEGSREKDRGAFTWTASGDAFWPVVRQARTAPIGGARAFPMTQTSGPGRALELGHPMGAVARSLVIKGEAA